MRSMARRLCLEIEFNLCFEEDLGREMNSVMNKDHSGSLVRGYSLIAE